MCFRCHSMPTSPSSGITLMLTIHLWHLASCRCTPAMDTGDFRMSLPFVSPGIFTCNLFYIYAWFHCYIYLDGPFRPQFYFKCLNSYPTILPVCVASKLEGSGVPASSFMEVRLSGGWPSLFHPQSSPGSAKDQYRSSNGHIYRWTMPCSFSIFMFTYST